MAWSRENEECKSLVKETNDKLKKIDESITFIDSYREISPEVSKIARLDALKKKYTIYARDLPDIVKECSSRIINKYYNNSNDFNHIKEYLEHLSDKYKDDDEKSKIIKLQLKKTKEKLSGLDFWTDEFLTF